jgi:molybdate transport system regulatory protein
VQGSLWIEAGGRSLGGHGRMALLQAVAEHGSITLDGVGLCLL